MNNYERPTIVLVAGAWHHGSIFNPVAEILRAQEYPVEMVTLLSTGGPTSTTVADDAAHIRNTVLNNLIAEGKEIILVLHSYAGIPGSDSIKGLVRRDLALKNQRGGVAALVYIAAFLLPSGQSVDSFLGGVEKLLTSEVITQSVPLITFIIKHPQGDKITVSDPIERFYNDLDAKTTEKCLADIAPYQAKPTIFTPATYDAYRDVPSTYLLCEKDAAMPFDLQKAMITTAGEDLIKSHICGAGHLPMLGSPQVVFDIIDRASNDAIGKL
jgi:pimeloyl-ACP methyl ester carboxylesterase